MNKTNTFRKINNDGFREMTTAYSALKAKQWDRSRPYLMLSELIDNSISSWEDGTNGGFLTDNLTIDITINFQKNFITCEDNAMGMNEESLLDSVQTNIEKDGDVLNMFGVGMKNAAFWFGEDLYISTNDGIKNLSTQVVISEKRKNNSLNDSVIWSLVTPKYPKKTRGTIIAIENVYEQKMFTKSDFLSKTIPILEKKYFRYLAPGKNGSTNIKVNIAFFSKNGEFYKYSLAHKPVKAQKIDISLIDKFSKLLDIHLKPRFILDLKEKVLNCVKDDKGLVFEFETPFNGKPLKFIFGVISQDKEANGKDQEFFKPHYGITAYQHKRAIRMSGHNPIEFGEGLDYVRTDIKRIFGYVSLGKIFKPDNNKTDFEMGLKKGEFETIINKIGKDLVDLATAVKSLVGVQRTAVVKQGQASVKKVQNELNSKEELLDLRNWNVSTEQAHCEYKNFNLTIIRKSITDPNNEMYFIDARRIGENQIHISINVEHPVWKPLIFDGNSIDFNSTLYPLAAIIGLSVVLASDVSLKRQDNNLLKIINDISRKGLV